VRRPVPMIGDQE